MSKKRKTVDPKPKQSNSAAEVFNGGRGWLFRALVGWRQSWREENTSAKSYKTKDLAVSAAFAAGYSKVKCEGITMTRKAPIEVETPASICKDETEAVAHLDDEELQELHRIRSMLHSDALRQKIVDEMTRRKISTAESLEAPKEEIDVK